MCLHTTNKFPRIATKDIETYKVVAKADSFVCSPYRTQYKWEFNKVIKDKESAKIVKRKFYRDGTKMETTQKEISRGFFHTYLDLDEARNMQNYFQVTASCLVEYTIVKCIIPKGTVYYSGVDDSGLKCYASKHIIMTDIEVIKGGNWTITRKINLN